MGDEERQDQQPVARLPVDLLAEVLRRVPPRWLAASRCVCRAWRDAVDGRRLLRADLLPLSVAGIFFHLDEHLFPEFLSCPSSSSAGARAVSGSLGFLRSINPNYSPDPNPCAENNYAGHVSEEAGDWDDYRVLDQCNGLLLLRQWVVNPATRSWDTLPPWPANNAPGNLSCGYREGLVYDPTVSPYYEVFMIPYLGYKHPDDEVDPLEESEWPPSLCKMHVFSSRSGCWEERFFARQGNAAGTVGEMRLGWGKFSTAFFQGTLYVYYVAGFVMRISMTDNTYRVIKSPIVREGYPYLGVVRSEKGLYFVSLDNGWLKVWILNESCGEIGWMLKHEKYLKSMVAPIHQEYHGRFHGDWILEDINYNLFQNSSHIPKGLKGYDDDDDDNDNGWLLGSGDEVEEYDGRIRILGFHPYKEIVFLTTDAVQTGFAYHLNSSKMEGLGNIYPRDYTYFKLIPNEREMILSCFPYTPCWIDESLRNN